VITLYGLKNCDTCRKATKWLTAKGIEHRLHDVRDDGVSADQIAAWTSVLGWEAVLNRRSTTWRQIPEAKRAHLNEARAVALMAENPTLIKRPVIDIGMNILVGFTKATEAELEKKAAR